MNNAIRNFSQTAAITGGLCAAAAASTCLAQAPQAPVIAPAQSDVAAHAFDFFFGTWRVHNRRLHKALANETTWDSFDGIQICEPLLGGRANYDELRDLNNGPIGMSIHLFDITTQSWSSRWVSAADGRMQPPLKGVFANGTGIFEGDDVHEGRPIRVRYTWSRISTPAPRWEQAFSSDGGTTWETNWVMDYVRMAPR